MIVIVTETEAVVVVMVVVAAIYRVVTATVLAGGSCNLNANGMGSTVAGCSICVG